MDRRLDRNSIESIKTTMKKHEDIFKQQVLELHRLYNVQKLLMDELRNELKQKKLWPPMNRLGLSKSARIDSHNQRTKQTAYELDFRFQCVREDSCSGGRSPGACSVETRMSGRRSFNLETPAEKNTIARIPKVDEGRGAGPSSNMAAVLKNSITSMDRSYCDENQVELTLSIGGRQTKQKLKSHQLELRCSDSHSTDTRDCSDHTNPISSSSVTFDQERKKSHWLFQGLNLK